MNSLSVLEINYAAVSFVMVRYLWAQTFVIKAEWATISWIFISISVCFFLQIRHMGISPSQHLPKNSFAAQKLSLPLVQPYHRIFISISLSSFDKNSSHGYSPLNICPKIHLQHQNCLFH